MANTQQFQQAIDRITQQQVKYQADLVDELTAIRAAMAVIATALDGDSGVTLTTYAAVTATALGTLRVTK